MNQYKQGDIVRILWDTPAGEPVLWVGVIAKVASLREIWINWIYPSKFEMVYDDSLPVMAHYPIHRAKDEPK